MNTTTQEAPEGLFAGGSIVALLCRIWGGASVLRREQDLPAIAGQMPPKDLVLDGTKRVIDPKVLNPLDALRKRAEAALKKVGVKFLGGYFVADTNLPTLLSDLGDIGAEFEALRDSLAADLPGHYQAWEDRHPHWAALLQGARLTPAEVTARCQFGTVTYKIAPVGDPSDPVNAGLAQASASFTEEIYADVAKEVTAILRDTFTARTGPVGQRALRPVRALEAKLRSFVFVDPAVGALANILQGMLAALPQAGHLTDAETSALVAQLWALSDPADAQRAAQSTPAPAMQASLIEPAEPIDAAPPVPEEEPEAAAPIVGASPSTQEDVADIPFAVLL